MSTSCCLSANIMWPLCSLFWLSYLIYKYYILLCSVSELSYLFCKYYLNIILCILIILSYLQLLCDYYAQYLNYLIFYANIIWPLWCLSKLSANIVESLSTSLSKVDTASILKNSLAFTMQMKICLWHQLIKGPPRVGWAEPKTVLKDLRYLSLPQCLSWGKASEMNIKYKLYKNRMKTKLETQKHFQRHNGPRHWVL